MRRPFVSIPSAKASSSLCAALAVLVLTGCPMPQTAGAKLQDSAQELVINARFGRMEMAIEHIAPKEREAWSNTHKGWGERIRIADAELAGIKVKETETEADVLVKIAWYRADEQELRVTTLKQSWKDVNGDFMLVGERWLEGDVGLLGEKPPRMPVSNAPPAPTQFPTIRIGGDDNGAIYRSAPN